MYNHVVAASAIVVGLSAVVHIRGLPPFDYQIKSRQCVYHNVTSLIYYDGALFVLPVLTVDWVFLHALCAIVISEHNLK